MITADMEQMNIENLNALLNILVDSDSNTLLMKAEIYRNLGQFELSKKILDRTEKQVP